MSLEKFDVPDDPYELSDDEAREVLRECTADAIGVAVMVSELAIEAIREGAGTKRPPRPCCAVKASHTASA